MIEMDVDSVRVSTMNYQRVVILKEKEAERYLPIWIGPAEADAIAIKLQGISTPRPMTHDLLSSVITALGASVSSINVCDLHNDTFYAKINLDINGGQVEIDSRPSDALALAVRTQSTIYAEEVVLNKAGVLIDKETGRPIPQAQAEEGISNEELKRLSAFRGFIDSLNLDDLGKGKDE